MWPEVTVAQSQTLLYEFRKESLCTVGGQYSSLFLCDALLDLLLISSLLLFAKFKRSVELLFTYYFYSHIHLLFLIINDLFITWSFIFLFITELLNYSFIINLF